MDWLEVASGSVLRSCSFVELLSWLGRPWFGCREILALACAWCFVAQARALPVAPCAASVLPWCPWQGFSCWFSLGFLAWLRLDYLFLAAVVASRYRA